MTQISFFLLFFVIAGCFAFMGRVMANAKKQKAVCIIVMIITAFVTLIHLGIVATNPIPTILWSAASMIIGMIIGLFEQNSQGKQ